MSAHPRPTAAAAVPQGAAAKAGRGGARHEAPAVPLKQLALDIGIAQPPTIARFFAGANGAALTHLQQWLDPHGAAQPVPLYLWGESGSGKTHLLRAAYEALRADGSPIGWLDPSVHNPPPCDEDWQAVLLDDVHLYDAAQQQRAFNWFVNALAPAEGVPRRVLATGSLPPADLKLREDLRSRLGWGHVFQLHLLDELARRAVLRQEADARGIVLGDEVVDFMLNRFSRDLGSLMTLLDHLDDFALRAQRAVTVPLLKVMLETE
ncbi:DnaA regulatory inactivator Hda [Xylophilus sp.]|uniref:DnaA regulatory inactivator Hda n=1 Tax=Xylophilus sp. TaxID=2653893 RepID=UPI0013B82EBA|nr:DnaA regulatory inactivator Hda [Xylophilus sp.]KAF1043179.1 MAG: DnaA regulatory inactivator Hda [Xylophilus sp.]